jgi:putative ABC transport system permease protein
MTAKQLKGIITRTTIINSAIGTPMGLLFGIGITIGFIPQILLVMDSGLSSNEVSAVPIWAYLIAAVFSFVTNLLSSVKPGKIVAECPPIEAIKYRGKMTANKIKKSERGGLLTMAYRNIWRDKKQAMIILISFVIMGTLFFISNVVIKGNDAKTILNTISENDLEVSNMTTLDENLPLITDKLIGKLTAIDGIKSIGLVSSAEAIVPYQEEIFGEFYRNLYSSRWTPGGDYQEAIEAYKKDPQLYTFTTRFVGIDHTEFLKLNAKLGNTLNESDFKSGKIAVIDNFFGIEMGDVMGKSVNFQIPSGLDPKAQQSISIAAVADGPAYFSGGYTPVINVSLEYAQTLIEQPHLEGINIVYDQPFSEHTEKQINDILAPEKRLSTESKLSRYKEMAPTEQQVKILGGSLAFLIAFLALLNYFSMAAASVQERLKEFAMLESIGMTQNQLKKMLAVEGVSYALLSIAISTIIGIPLSFLVFQSIKVYDIAYAIPWITIVLLYLVITLLCISIPVALFRRSQKDCLMERLRKEI